jgi:Domain of Unknown Function (DUF1080)
MSKMFSLIVLFSVFTLDIQAQNKDEWETLFNGKDFKGWKQLNGKAKYEVQNGEVVGTTVEKEPNSFMVTEKDYGDFILELEFKVPQGMNSGIQFRSLSKPDFKEGRVHGYQFEIDPSPRAWTGGIYDEARRDWLYTLEYNPDGKRAFKQDEWNKIRLECIGNSLRTWVNGIAAAHVYDDVTASGFIALQVHAIQAKDSPGAQIRWRNIRIQTKNLKPSPPDNVFIMNLVPNAVSEAEKKQGIVSLWDGKTTAGWRGAYKDKFPDKGWELKDGAISIVKSTGAESENGGDIVTVNDYGAFDLQFEFKLTEGANSGLKYFVTEKEGNKGSAIGLEYQVLDDAKHPDAKEGVVGNRTLASLYDLIPAIKVQRGQRKIGEWNWGRVVVFPDGKIEHWLNGYKVVEYQRGTPIYSALVARSKYAKLENFGMAEKGRILLQDHGDSVSFRSLRIRELK